MLQPKRWGGLEVDDATWQPQEMSTIASYWGHHGLFDGMGPDGAPPMPAQEGQRAPLQVLVRDAYGQPVKGASVAFSLGTGPTGAGASFLAGGGQASALSDANGLATSPPFLANASSGRFLASAATADIPSVVAFTLVNHASTAKIVPAPGAVQRTRAGTRFPRRLQVRVLDADLQPIEGATVTFSLSDDVAPYRVLVAGHTLDGRITGRTRTCWFETLQYDGLGVPYGPYCH
jgi:hypothetical protein